MTQIAITNAGGTLNCDAIAYNEKQRCDVAIRDIPTKSTGSLVDVGTYVLKNRQMKMTIRVTDAGLSTLLSIFNASVNCTVTMVTNTGTWTYTAWLVKKPTKYEYSKNPTDTKEWIVKLEFVVSTFSFA